MLMATPEIARTRIALLRALGASVRPMSSALALSMTSLAIWVRAGFSLRCALAGAAMFTLTAFGFQVNDIFDYLKDSAAQVQRPIATGELSRRNAAFFAAALLIGTFLIAAWVGDGWPWVAAAATALMLYTHAARTFPLAKVRKVLPQAGNGAPSVLDRVACFTYAVIPWIPIAAIIRLQANPFAGKSAFITSGAGNLMLRGAAAVVIGSYVAFAFAPAIARSPSDLRRVALRSLACMAVAFAVCLAIPLVLNSHVVSVGVLWHLTGPNTGAEGPWKYFPSLPVLFALLFADCLSKNSRWTRLPAYCWIALVTLSCMMLSTPSILLVQTELVRLESALITYAVACNLASIWRAIRFTSERIANSWHEWRFGPVRVINHGAFAGLAAFLGVWISGALAGPGHLTAILFAASCAIVGSALWAQYVEGSAQLLRPYGFYGGLLGGTLGALAAPLFHTSVWLLLGVFSASGSLVQAAGRLRCLVQGCCHGRPASESTGIRYVHPRSRVCRLSQWTNVPLHPTPVYSILWNCAVTLLLFRLWLAHSSLHLIVGLYFMLSGLGRFVEESWRGEPQTKTLAGLRLYQWAAIASLVLGALFTAFDNGELAPAPSLQWGTLLAAALFGLVGFCAMGVDFPESTRRFSRLT